MGRVHLEYAVMSSKNSKNWILYLKIVVRFNIAAMVGGTFLFITT